MSEEIYRLQREISDLSYVLRDLRSNLESQVSDLKYEVDDLRSKQKDLSFEVYLLRNPGRLGELESLCELHGGRLLNYFLRREFGILYEYSASHQFDSTNSPELQRHMSRIAEILSDK